MDLNRKNNNTVLLGGVVDSNKIKVVKRRLRVGDPDFQPPDGGWGWLVVFACGFSNLSTFPMFQQFGLVFKEKYEHIGITNAETTTIINLNSAFNACVGLLNGPLFRIFSYRKIAFCGAAFVAVSLFFTTFCHSFWTYIVIYSIFYGTGIGVTQSANSLALNTYFKSKRRIATGLSWSTTALGPIVWPYIITFFMSLYGMEGTLLLFAAFSGHAIVCSLLLHPVHWHTKFRSLEDEECAKPLVDVPSDEGFVEGQLTRSRKSRSIFSSQYLYNEDDPVKAGYEIIDPGTPRMVGANDGWYSQNRSLVGSRVSLTSNKDSIKGNRSRLPSGQNSVAISKRPSYNNLIDAKKKKGSHSKPTITEELGEECPIEKQAHVNNNKKPNDAETPVKDIEFNEKYVLKSAAKKLAEYKETVDEEEKQKELEEAKRISEEKLKTLEVEKQYTFLEKICIFFDFGLLKDPTYVILMLGITIANFVEINFSILTPFVLQEFAFEKYQIATFMSLLGVTDIIARLFVPFLAEKIGWENKTFFLLGVLSMAVGRIILVHSQTYSIGLLVAVIIGFGKGLRTIFMALVIPSYVSLEKLPAASGLQLTTSGLLFLFLGPVVGWIRDIVDNYVITLHILNLMTYTTVIGWTVHDFLNKRKARNGKV